MNWNSHSVYKLNVPHYKKNYYWFWISPHFFSYHLYGLMNKCHYLSISILTGILLCTLTGPCLQEIRVGGGFLSTKSWYNIFGQKNEGKISLSNDQMKFLNFDKNDTMRKMLTPKGYFIGAQGLFMEERVFPSETSMSSEKNMAKNTGAIFLKKRWVLIIPLLAEKKI